MFTLSHTLQGWENILKLMCTPLSNQLGIMRTWTGFSSHSNARHDFFWMNILQLQFQFLLTETKLITPTSFYSIQSLKNSAPKSLMDMPDCILESLPMWSQLRICIGFHKDCHIDLEDPHPHLHLQCVGDHLLVHNFVSSSHQGTTDSTLHVLPVPSGSLSAGHCCSHGLE